MELNCRIIPKDDRMRIQLVSRLEALGESPTQDGEVVSVDYSGNYNQHAMAIISVFESFGCDRAIVFKDWGSDEG